MSTHFCRRALTFAVLLPAFVIAVVVSRCLVQFKDNEYVISVINGLKPVGCGLLAGAGAQLFVNNVNNLFGAALLGTMLVMYFYKKRSPIFVLGVCAVAGLLAGLT